MLVELVLLFLVWLFLPCSGGNPRALRRELGSLTGKSLALFSHVAPPQNAQQLVPLQGKSPNGTGWWGRFGEGQHGRAELGILPEGRRPHEWPQLRSAPRILVQVRPRDGAVVIAVVIGIGAAV